MSGTSGRRRGRHSGGPQHSGRPISTDQRPLAEPRAGLLPVVTLKTPTPHPNIFRKRIQDIPGEVQPGDCVAVRLPDGTPVGFGYCNPRSSIALRMISTQTEPPDEAHWDRLLERAVRLRTETLQLDEVTSACRLINAEGDFLPGLVVDRYDDVLSVEAFSLAIFQRVEAITERLAKIAGTKHTIIRTSPSSESQEGYTAESLTSAELPGTVNVHEFGTRFRVAFEGGHKTGFFCDQRDNRRRLALECGGKSVVDLCSYTGGFAVQAKKLGKAAEVIGVELDRQPLELAKTNANLNQARINFVCADIFPWMRDMIRNERQFDVVVLDPPKLIRSREELEDGTRIHFDMNRLAMQLVRPGGLMVSFTCSGLLGRAEFDRLICSAARQAGDPLPGESPESEFRRRGPRDVQIIDRTGPGGDHPIATSCPESDYLKATWMRLW